MLSTVDKMAVMLGPAALDQLKVAVEVAVDGLRQEMMHFLLLVAMVLLVRTQ
jgi:hypothetical protein